MAQHSGGTLNTDHDLVAVAKTKYLYDRFDIGHLPHNPIPLKKTAANAAKAIFTRSLAESRVRQTFDVYLRWQFLIQSKPDRIIDGVKRPCFYRYGFLASSCFSRCLRPLFL